MAAVTQNLLLVMGSRNHGRTEETISHPTEDLVDSALGKSERLLLEFDKLGLSLDDCDDDGSTCVETAISSPSAQSDLEEDDASGIHQPSDDPSPLSPTLKEGARTVRNSELDKNSQALSRLAEHFHDIATAAAAEIDYARINSRLQKLENEMGALKRGRRAVAGVIQSPQHTAPATPQQPRQLAPHRSRAALPVHSTRAASPQLRAARSAVPGVRALSPTIAPFVASASPRRLFCQQVAMTQTQVYNFWSLQD